ncbi:putative thiol oxidoreductase [Caenispirillum salinarum AK4]|uniref:Putative thiol oxidoreductase n=1 Tax=Caenispirillum salinarum AK4 TaxID=1238182 RepID=K9HLN3_9PROT|nr:di-heme oxidoredictase family protein [Caenispirillum salinarum]EKV29481.1 putative thiol oxidoreductase [Caenispirillum salinarum AK4]
MKRFLTMLAVGAFAAAPLAAATADTAADDGRAGLAPTTDFSAPEPGEDRPGGDTTHTKRLDRNAFSHSSANMAFEREMNFKVGNGFFRRLWVSAPASTKAADGLGPLYNAKSCQRCHLKDGRGHPPAANHPDDVAESMFLRLSIPPQDDAQRKLLETHQATVIPDPVYGGQLQDLAIQGHAAEGRMHITYEEETVELSGGETASLRHPTYTVTDLGYGPMHPDVMISPRVAPQMIGLGLLEQVPAEQILALADPDDADGDGISGKPQWVTDPETGEVVLGRFGWKAGNPTIDAQAQGAFAGDMGISTPMKPAGSGECTSAQEPCIAAIHGGDEQYDGLEAHQQVTDLVLFYSRHLAVPARRDADDPQVLRGKGLFYGIGCASCHNPKFRTAADGPEPELRDQLIWPYTDMLLHDMGEGLADNRPEGEASGREWRTAPLWGIGLTETVSGHTNFLHDGRARNVTEAVLWHGGEAKAAREAFRTMPKEDRDALLRFVNSL